MYKEYFQSIKTCELTNTTLTFQNHMYLEETEKWKIALPEEVVAQRCYRRLVIVIVMPNFKGTFCIRNHSISETYFDVIF